jgi:hypothetical protein
MLTDASALECFETIPGSKICESHCCVQAHQRTSSRIPKTIEGRNTMPFDKSQRPFVAAAADHTSS